MASTRSDLVQYVLQKIFVPEGNEDIDASEQATGLAIVNARVAYLRETENVYWDDDSIPDSVKDSLGEYLTHYFQPAFAPDENGAYYTRSKEGLRELQGLLATMADSSPIAVDFF